ncbi:unnamed protein product [Adineta ricciae]|uniref:Uncharacterized protein n=1 Tax=Adineta ricciae TaxID=249248 RepID=A0A814L8N6_ADIRI|nr:unnamed protein product [Adineta ricciae]CAF1237703.1 unnamed protein product [Adineta ricciae]
MAFLMETAFKDPAIKSLLFLFGNVLLFIFIISFVHSWTYTLIYIIIQIVIFRLINERLRSGHSYTSTKNLNNQTVIVTGAASGIGRITAIELATLHARVIVGIRNQTRAERIAQELSKESNGNVIGYHLDLSDLASVKAFAEKIDKVDILINNAGVMKGHKEFTKDGLESTFGTNHIGHFYLTQLLLPLLIKSNGRIVNVSSLGHVFVKENTDFIHSNSYDPFQAESESKLANILHANELQRRYGNQGIKAYSLSPGRVGTTGITRDNKSYKMLIISLLSKIISKSIRQGAMTTLYCALSDEAQPGKFHSNCQVAQPSSIASDSKKARELWELSEKIIHEKTEHL